MRRKLLLIEDDPGIATMLPTALRSLGHDVLVARDGRLASEIAASEAESIDVVLCDAMLPDGPGPIAAAAVRGYCPDAWIVFTSGYPIDLLAERGVLSAETLSALAAGYLAKPFLPRDVHNLIERRFAAGKSDVTRLESVVREWSGDYGQFSH